MRQRKVIAETGSESQAETAVQMAVTLEAASGIEQASPLHAVLIEHLDDRAAVTVAADKVEQIHGAVLQLLCLFARERLERGTCLRIVAPSPAFYSAASAIGAVDLLSLSQVPT